MGDRRRRLFAAMPKDLERIWIIAHNAHELKGNIADLRSRVQKFRDEALLTWKEIEKKEVDKWGVPLAATSSGRNMKVKSEAINGESNMESEKSGVKTPQSGNLEIDNVSPGYDYAEEIVMDGSSELPTTPEKSDPTTEHVISLDGKDQNLSETKGEVNESEVDINGSSEIDSSVTAEIGDCEKIKISVEAPTKARRDVRISSGSETISVSIEDWTKVWTSMRTPSPSKNGLPCSEFAECPIAHSVKKIRQMDPTSCESRDAVSQNIEESVGSDKKESGHQETHNCEEAHCSKTGRLLVKVPTKTRNQVTITFGTEAISVPIKDWHHVWTSMHTPPPSKYCLPCSDLVEKAIAHMDNKKGDERTKCKDTQKTKAKSKARPNLDPGIARYPLKQSPSTKNSDQHAQKLSRRRVKSHLDELGAYVQQKNTSQQKNATFKGKIVNLVSQSMPSVGAEFGKHHKLPINGERSKTSSTAKEKPAVNKSEVGDKIKVSHDTLQEIKKIMQHLDPNDQDSAKLKEMLSTIASQRLEVRRSDQLNPRYSLATTSASTELKVLNENMEKEESKGSFSSVEQGLSFLGVPILSSTRRENPDVPDELNTDEILRRSVCSMDSDTDCESSSRSSSGYATGMRSQERISDIETQGSASKAIHGTLGGENRGNWSRNYTPRKIERDYSTSRPSTHHGRHHNGKEIDCNPSADRSKADTLLGEQSNTADIKGTFEGKQSENSNYFHIDTRQVSYNFFCGAKTGPAIPASSSNSVRQPDNYNSTVNNNNTTGRNNHSEGPVTGMSISSGENSGHGQEHSGSSQASLVELVNHRYGLHGEPV